MRRTFLLSVLILLYCSQGYGFSLQSPEKTGVALVLGSSYDPQPSFGLAQLNLMALYDYEQIMPHRAPDSLRFKLEVNLGVVDDSRYRALLSGNFLALYYLHGLETANLSPYIEAGAGLAYSDFQVDGQGLRVNFNPQAGIGVKWKSPAGIAWYSALRASHLSNSEFHRDNRGVNAVTWMLGILFD